MSYILESDAENQRLERQAKEVAYNFREDLDDLDLTHYRRILDAGCGSGVVSRHLSKNAPRSQVTGCDVSGPRIADAAREAQGLSNLRFEQRDLRRSGFPDGSFDLIYSRYVAEHQTPENLFELAKEWRRLLAPGGTLRVVDVDGCFFNLYPQPPIVAQGLAKLQSARELDLWVGRKLSHVFTEAGFKEVDIRVVTHVFRGDSLQAEIQIVADRFKGASKFFEKVLGSEWEFRKFSKEYLAAMSAPGSTLFYNRFIVTFTR